MTTLTLNPAQQEAIAFLDSEIASLLISTKQFKQRVETKAKRQSIVCRFTSTKSLLAKIKKSAEAEKIKRIFEGDWSDFFTREDADLWLCRLLAYWTGRAFDWIDEIYRTTKLYSSDELWDTPRGLDTYGEYIIRRGLNETEQVYSPTCERYSQGWVVL